MKSSDFKKRANKTILIKDEIEEFLNELGLDTGLYSLKLTAIWKESVGESISKFSKPVVIKRGKLYVSVENSVWRYELSMKKQEIITAFNENIEKLSNETSNMSNKKLSINKKYFKPIREIVFV
ncbi:MAG: DUF721 domain-containing protein [Ignavibacteria bacterium]|nr:DUF721 domain-containing protein [Ignavibacteria bacterium]